MTDKEPAPSVGGSISSSPTRPPGESVGAMKPSGRTQFLPSSQVPFEPVTDGVEVASVIGDHKSGPHGTFVRLAPGTRLPLHHYDQALAGVVVAGNLTHPVPGHPDSQQTLGPGSLFSFAANEPHETNNVGEGFALFFIFQEHPWVLAMDV
jgi:quercetin dioxygenase-like cupin family protein